MKKLRFLIPTLAAIAAFGCGGSGETSSTPETAGNARISIEWPPTTRLIPDASNSITVSFLRGASVVASETVARPEEGGTSTLEFTGLPAQTLTLRAQAFPTANGSGTAQASATKAVTIVGNTMNNMAITMASTIETVSMSPTLANLAINGTRTIVASPVNVNGATVLVDPDNVTWTSSSPAVASVSSAGLVTGLTAGTTTIRFTDTESGKFGTATINVSSGLGNVDVEIQ